MASGVVALLRNNCVANQNLRIRLAIACALLYPASHPAAAQDGATYEDEIEKRRKELFGPDGKFREPPPPEPAPQLHKKSSADPFKRWDRLERTGGVTFQADASITGRDIYYWKDAKAYKYGTFNDLQKRFLAFPPPPIPPIKTNISQIWQNNPPPNTAPLYDPLLQFLAAGPGPNGVGTLGNTITVTQLQQITPSLLALAPQLRQLQNQSISFYQLLNSPQGVTFLSLAQSVLQPLGMWNSNTLLAWANYMTPYSSQSQLINLLTTLEADILAALNLPPGQYVTVVTTTQDEPVNPFAVVGEMTQLWQEGDKEEIAERFPGLAHSLIKHLGFTKPQGVLYANRKGRKDTIWPYNVGVITEQRKGNKRDVWVLNQSGFFINPYASGVGRYYQGPDDLTLSYVPFKVEGGNITTLDVRASHDYTLYKRAVGGSTKILNRAATDSTSLLQLDIPFLDDHLHLRMFGGTTPYAATGGSALRLDYGQDLFKGHLGGMLGYRDTYFDGDADDFIGYLETENIIRTPYVSVVGGDQRGLRFWGSLTLAATGMATRPLGGAEERRWTLQAEGRAIPEFHMQLATPYALFGFVGGITSAIVPGGNVNLKNPERTLGLYPIRSHVEFTCLVDLSEVIPANLEFGAVYETSKLVDHTRAGVRFDAHWIYVDWLAEIEHYKDSDFTDLRVGGGFGYSGVNVTFLQSLEDEDFRLQASIDVGALLAGETVTINRGLLDSYAN